MSEQKSFLMYVAEMVELYRADRRRNSSQETQIQPGRLPRVLRWLMPNGGTLLLVAALIATAQVWAKPLASPTGAPGPSATTVNYQGRLADSGGSPLDGTYGMSFSLWDAATGGSVVWGPESHAAVPVSEGLFSVGLGSQTPGGIPTTTWDGDRYLEITVGGETLSPRELIRSVPIAGIALTVPDGAIGPDQIADGAIDSRNARLSTGRVQAGSLQLTNEYQDVPGTTLTLTPATDQTYLIYVTADFQATDAIAVAQLHVDGVYQSGEIHFKNQGDQGRGTVSQAFLVNLNAGTHTLVLKAVQASGTSAYVYGTHTTITYFAISQ